VESANACVQRPGVCQTDAHWKSVRYESVSSDTASEVENRLTSSRRDASRQVLRAESYP
jgi:hypothetical protein